MEECTAGGLGWRSARAQAANTIKIGVLTDMSGPYRDINGPVTVACTRLAVQEFGARGFGVEVVVADHQNRPDVALNIARQWYDREGVDIFVGQKREGQHHVFLLFCFFCFSRSGDEVSCSRYRFARDVERNKLR